ncbi:SDR family oxidoreductase [Parazoarcus communis]|uniref:NAD(P)-dependent oxidoreductase n=1 Tax=Parazoarcus communis SWub3 = DSM 12120 TaxID=1121029 RepID=A0A323UVQ9_9RHOO|nr:SDR family oxidoreductase [Parazoarcus communis]NMG71578.1 NAD(P)H-binding protein [Parazoarcus communis SWub3 = DSM 12120]PZA16515.1 NAD(P)-dependent oxidoreductase [Azoarcus communis] [Parazoarcus communis SWub3 = DSM 12120]
MIVVTGASGQLGRLVIQSLLSRMPATQIVAAVRRPESVADLAALGVVVRQADYTQPASLDAAFKGAEKILLVSSSEVGQRSVQHRNVIDAARRAGVALLAYTSLLHADTSPLALREEHLETEAWLQSSGVPAVVLRNGWYTENYLASVPPALAHGAFIGCAGDGRIASAARADYAEAAAVVLTTPGQAGKVYELAGDEAYTLSEFAAELSRQSGKAIPYVDLDEAGFKAALLDAGLPAPLAELLANSDRGASQGGLFDDQCQLSQLIGRPTTGLAALMAAALE